MLADPDQRGLAPATVHKAVHVLNKALRAAVDDRLIPANPADRLPVPTIERQEMRFLTTPELSALAEAIDPRYRAFVLLGGYGGLRLGELLGLRWQRVHLDDGRVGVTETLTEVRGHIAFGPPKTRAGHRSIALPRSVVEALAEHRILGQQPGDLVFTSSEGQPIRASLFRRRVWTPAAERAGLSPFRIHDLRHTAVALWIAAGANAKQIAVRAGHTSVSVVLDRYGHLYPDQDERLADALRAARLTESAMPGGAY